MAFGNRTAVTYDVGFNVQTGTLAAGMGEAEAVYRRTTGAMSRSALELTVAQNNVTRAVVRYGAESPQAQRATIGLLRTQEALASQTNRTSVALANEERTLGRLGRGALAGSGIFRGLGRSLAFASTAFLGGTGLVYGIRSAVKAAEEHQVVLGQERVALHNAGLNYDQYAGQIAAADKSLGHLGFTEADSARSLTTLIRARGNVAQAIRLEATAADIARARNVSLQVATNAVAKAASGQDTQLRRLIPGLSKTAHGYDLITEAQRKTAGAAANYATTAQGAQDRFNVALRQTEVAIGTALLPQVTAYLNKGADWLEQSKNQQRVAHDVQVAVHDLGVVLHIAADGFKAVDAVVSPFVTALGGVENTLKILVGLKLASVLAGWAGGFKAVAIQEDVAAAAATRLAGAEAAAGGAGVGGGLLRGLGGRAVLTNPLTIAAAAIVASALYNKGKRSQQKAKWDALSPGDQNAAFAAASPSEQNFLLNTLHWTLKPLPSQSGGAGASSRFRNRPAQAGAPGVPSKPQPSRPLTAQERVTLAIANAPEGSDALITALREQENLDRKTISFGEKLLKDHKGNTGQLVATLTRLKDQDQGFDAQITSILQGRANQKKTADAKKLAVVKSQNEEAARVALAISKALEASTKIFFKSPGGAKTGIAAAAGPVAGTKADIRAEESQFLQSVGALIHGVAPNFNSRGEMHLGNLVMETRKQTAVVSELVKQGRFPGSVYAAGAANGVFG